jgi:hypothetical protein
MSSLTYIEVSCHGTIRRFRCVFPHIRSDLKSLLCGELYIRTKWRNRTASLSSHFRKVLFAVLVPSSVSMLIYCPRTSLSDGARVLRCTQKLMAPVCSLLQRRKLYFLLLGSEPQ